MKTLSSMSSKLYSNTRQAIASCNIVPLPILICVWLIVDPKHSWSSGPYDHIQIITQNAPDIYDAYCFTLFQLSH